MSERNDKDNNYYGNADKVRRACDKNNSSTL